MNKPDSLKIIDAVYSQMDGPQDGFSTVRDILYRLCLASEKDHRRFMGPRQCGITAGQAAKLFAVQLVAKGLKDPDKWSIDDINSVRLECLKAQAYAKKHHAEFLAAFDAAGVSIAEALAVDYSELMK